MDNNMTLYSQYEQKASAFLKKAIAGLVCAAFPIASIVAIFLGSGNHKDIVNYISAGGMHTAKIKTCAALSKGSIFAGIGMTILYAIYSLYLILMLLAIAFGIMLPDQH